VRRAVARWGALGVAMALGVAGCAHAVPGSALPSGISNAQQLARGACAELPKAAFTTAFGVSNVTVTGAGGTTLSGNVLQITCSVKADAGFLANVVLQTYPNSVLGSPQRYLSLLRHQFPELRTTSVPGADVAGTFQRADTTGLVDEAFTATIDNEAGTLNVLLAGVTDHPGASAKLITFVTALARD
jgi:hypothetical protein